MVSIRDINQTITIFEKLDQKSYLKLNYCLKFCLIDAAGWVEEKLCDILNERIDRVVSDRLLAETVKKNVRQINSQIKYEKLRERIVYAIGEAAVLQMEDWLQTRSSFDFDNFKSSLGNLGSERNRHAHTHMNRASSFKLGFRTIRIELVRINHGLKLIHGFIRLLP